MSLICIYENLLELLEEMNDYFLLNSDYKLQDYIKIIKYLDPSSYNIEYIENYINSIYLSGKTLGMMKIMREENNNIIEKNPNIINNIKIKSFKFIEINKLINSSINNSFSILPGKVKMMLSIPIIWTCRKLRFIEINLKEIFINNNYKSSFETAYNESYIGAYNILSNGFRKDYLSKNISSNICKLKKLFIHHEFDIKKFIEELHILTENIIIFMLSNKIILNKFARET